MSHHAAGADDVATRLWARAVEMTGTPDDVAAVTDVVLGEVEHGLHRWVGAEGYSALLSRATAVTILRHPALHSVADLDVSVSTTSNGRVYSGDEQRLAILALLVCLMELLGRIIGNDMAVRLLEHIASPSPRGTVRLPSNLARDDE